MGELPTDTPGETARRFMLAMSRSSSRRRLLTLRMPSAAEGGLIVDVEPAIVLACGVDARELLGAASLDGIAHGNADPVGVETTGESILISSL